MSLWSLSYFAALIIPKTTALLCVDRILPVALNETGVAIDGSGTVLGLRVKHAGHLWAETESPRRFDTLCEGHLRPFVETFAARSRLPQRLLWANAAAILDFVVGELVATTAVQRAVREEAEAILGDVASPLRVFSGGKRKVCCLRYRLPGMAPCPASARSTRMRSPPAHVPAARAPGWKQAILL